MEGLEWENLALYNGRPIQIPQQLGFSMPNENRFAACSSSKFPEPSSLDGFGIIGCSPEPMIGLRLGQHKEYGQGSRTLLSSSFPVSSTPTKRSRASYHNMQNPCCQVEGCNLDLKLAKDYHRRHRICETHSKSPKVIVAGMERRFCQQCSRFHDLSEFDDKKRSCRRRLSDHNARRRRVQLESVQLSSPGLSPALYETDQRQQNVLLNGLPVTLPNSRWENANHALIRPSKPRGVEGTLNFSGDSLHSPQILDQCLHVGSTNSSMAPDLVGAHSLLSSNAWSMNEGEYSPVTRHSDLTLFHTNNVGTDEGPHIPLLNLHNSHHQEYQLFRDPYHSATF